MGKRKKKKKSKSRLLISFESFWLEMLIRSVKTLSVEMSYSLADIIGAGAFVFDKRHRVRAIQHILHAGMASDEREARALAKRNFKSLSRLAVDTFKIDAGMTPENVEKHVKVSGSKQAIKLVFEDKKPIIAVAPHLANVAFIPTVYAMMTDKKMLSVIRPYDNPRLGEIMERIQVRYGSELCSKKGAMKSLFKALRGGDSIGMVVDQHPGRKNGVETTFFGHPALTHASPALLHLKTGVPLCPLAMPRTEKPGTFEFVFKDPITLKPSKDRDKDVEILAQRCTDAMEEFVREYPEQWFWSHRRWLDINRKGYKHYQNPDKGASG